MVKIDWTARGLEIDDALQARVEQQLQKLGRYLPGEAEAHAIVTAEGAAGSHPHTSVEVIVRHRLGTFTSKHESADMAEAMREVLGHLDTQAHKAHDKFLQARRKGSGRAVAEPGETR